MDFFNPMFWADDSGRYTIWGSVYPPLNFLFLKSARWLLFGDLRQADGFALRDIARPMIPWILLAYGAATLFIFRQDLWHGFTDFQKALLFVACTLSPPMLFTIERGNLIIFALGFLALAFARPGWARAFAIGVLINIKPYFALYLVALALTRRPKELVACTMVAGVIFLFSGIVLDDHFLTFIPNTMQFSQENALFSAREILSLPSSISAFTYVLQTYFSQGGSLSIAGFDIAMITSIIELTRWLGIAGLLAVLALAGRNVPEHFALAAMTVAITNLGVWVGGYSFIFYIVLIPIFLRMAYWKFYLAMVALILLPIDVITILQDNIGNQYSYLSNATVSVDWQLGFGAIARPTINFGLLLAITFEILGKYAHVPRAFQTILQGASKIFGSLLPETRRVSGTHRHINHS